MTTTIYAIAVLPDEEVADWVSMNRKGLAQNFPAHVTLKSRFRVRPGTSLDEVVTDISPIFRTPAFNATLDGPMYIDGRIRWIECLTGNQGSDVLNRLHRACVTKLLAASYVWDYETPGDYELDGFRPHITLDWNDHGIHVPERDKIQEHIRVRTVFEAWIIMQYTEDHLRRGVNLVHNAPLQSWASEQSR